MIVSNGLVLLSGGMDSVAALYWARERYESVAALSFDYGQPNLDAELYCAQTVVESLGVPWTRVPANLLFPRRGLLAGVQDHDERRAMTLNAAFVPGRNIVLLAVAASHACSIFPNGNMALVVGATKDDASGFPDCRAGALAKLGEALRVGTARQIEIVAPWVDRTKEQILRSLAPAALEAVRRSWSCYRGAGPTGHWPPCGACTACVVRARAFAAVGVDDACVQPRVTGGDWHGGRS